MYGKTEGDVAAHLKQITDRLDDHEKRIDRLQNTLGALAKEIEGVTIGGTCGSCEQCLMVHKDGMMYCPKCGNGRSL